MKKSLSTIILSLALCFGTCAIAGEIKGNVAGSLKEHLGGRQRKEIRVVNLTCIVSNTVHRSSPFPSSNGSNCTFWRAENQRDGKFIYGDDVYAILTVARPPHPPLAVTVDYRGFKQTLPVDVTCSSSDISNRSRESASTTCTVTPSRR